MTRTQIYILVALLAILLAAAGGTLSSDPEWGAVGSTLDYDSEPTDAVGHGTNS
jgi:hypothetical protein